MDCRASPTAQTFFPLANQELKQDTARAIYVLILVDQNPFVLRAEVFPDFGVILKKLYRLNDQVGKIDDTSVLKKSFVGIEDFCDLDRPFSALHRIRIASGCGEHVFSKLPIPLRPDQLILRARDRSQYVPQGECRLVQLQIVFQRQ